MKDKTLILTVGLPRSGKSTWAMKQGFPVVNPDSIRLALHGQAFRAETEPFVWAIAKTMVRALFLTGYATVILDACNVSKHRRDEWRSKDWDTEFREFKTPIETCRDRAMRSGQDYLLPVITRMAKELAWPVSG